MIYLIFLLFSIFLIFSIFCVFRISYIGPRTGIQILL